MSTRKHYYLFVPVENIYNIECDTNGHTINKKEADHIFDEYRIPLKFRKIVIKINTHGAAEPTDVFEPITNKAFQFKTSFLKALINPLSNPVIELSSDDMVIITENKIHTAEVAKDFYQDIINQNVGYLYGNAIKEIFGENKEKENNGLFAKIKKKKF